MTTALKNRKIEGLNWRDIITIILSGTAILLFFIFFHLDKDRIRNYHSFISLLIIINNTLVGLNNFFFILEMNSVSKLGDYTFLDKKLQKEDKFFTKLFVIFNLFSLIISIYIVSVFVTNYINPYPLNDWDKRFHLSEILNFIMFIFFIIADSSMLKGFKNSISSLIVKINKNNELKEKLKNDIEKITEESVKTHIRENLESLDREQATTEENLNELVNGRKLTKYALWIIDIVGTIGIGAILLISQESILKQCDFNLKHTDFAEGFTAGAIALHIFITQLILAMLKPVMISADKQSEKARDHISEII